MANMVRWTLACAVALRAHAAMEEICPSGSMCTNHPAAALLQTISKQNEAPAANGSAEVCVPKKDIHNGNAEYTLRHKIWALCYRDGNKNSDIVTYQGHLCNPHGQIPPPNTIQWTAMQNLGYSCSNSNCCWNSAGRSQQWKDDWVGRCGIAPRQVPHLPTSACPGEWVLVFRQSYPTMYSANQWSRNPANPHSSNFAILDTLENYRQEDGKFKFKLSWPDPGRQDQIWKQTSNPKTKTTPGAENYEPVNVPYTGERWGGLEYGGANSLLDGSVNVGNWWYAVGSFHPHGNGIPGPAGTIARKVELYAEKKERTATMIPHKYMTASQSTTFGGMEASSALTADPDVHCERNFDCTCSITNEGHQQWWKASLDRAYSVQYLELTNRDAFPERLQNVNIYVSGKRCAKNVNIPIGGTQLVPCPGYGSEIKIYGGEGGLTLCGFKAYEEVSIAIA